MRSIDTSVHVPTMSETAEAVKAAETRQRIIPTDLDVLSGSCRSHPFMSHPGTVKFANTIKVSRPEYRKLKYRTDKTLVIDRIMASVHDRGGRFLFLDDDSGTWIEMNRRKITDKIGHALRVRFEKGLKRKKKSLAIVSDIEAKDVGDAGGHDKNALARFVMKLEHAKAPSDSIPTKRKAPSCAPLIQPPAKRVSIGPSPASVDRGIGSRLNQVTGARPMPDEIMSRNLATAVRGSNVHPGQRASQVSEVQRAAGRASLLPQGPVVNSMTTRPSLIHPDLGPNYLPPGGQRLMPGVPRQDSRHSQMLPDQILSKPTAQKEDPVRPRRVSTDPIRPPLHNGGVAPQYPQVRSRTGETPIQQSLAETLQQTRRRQQSVVLDMSLPQVAPVVRQGATMATLPSRISASRLAADSSSSAELNAAMQRQQQHAEKAATRSEQLSAGLPSHTDHELRAAAGNHKGPLPSTLTPIGTIYSDQHGGLVIHLPEKGILKYVAHFDSR